MGVAAQRLSERRLHPKQDGLRVEHLMGYQAVVFLLERNDEGLEMGH